MRSTFLFAPLLLLAACSPPTSSVSAQQVQVSEQSQAAMARINNANFGAMPRGNADQIAVEDGTPVVAAADNPAPVQQAADVPKTIQYNAALVRIEVALDRAHFSPGVIDGQNGDNVRKAVSAYQEAHNLPINGQADDALLQTLTSFDTAPALVTYTITADDVQGPFAPVPQDLEAMSHLQHLGYARASEGLAEKFHMDEDLLKKLNPNVDFAHAGTPIIVANAGGDLSAQVASIVIDKHAKTLRALDASGQLVAFYPASIGSPDAPAPSGDFTVRSVAFNPTYHYDPSRLPTFGRTGHGALTIAAGPNNPVGDVWIALSLDTYGIHGAPEAQNVSKTQSHGCVRLTNWDATELGHAVRAGVPVSFQDGVVEAANQ